MSNKKNYIHRGSDNLDVQGLLLDWGELTRVYQGEKTEYLIALAEMIIYKQMDKLEDQQYKLDDLKRDVEEYVEENDTLRLEDQRLRGETNRYREESHYARDRVHDLQQTNSKNNRKISELEEELRILKAAVQGRPRIRRIKARVEAVK